MVGVTVSVRPIGAEDVDSASRFLNEHLNSRVTIEDWARLLSPPWADVSPNRGFLLAVDDAVVGVYAAVYSERVAGERKLRICNLAAFCVLEEHRMHGLRLLRALLAQKGYEFTDLSPSGNVVALNERLGFKRVPSAARLVLNLPQIGLRSTAVSADPALLASTLRGVDARVYRDHQAAPAANHLLVERDGAHGYLIFRRDRRKGLPLFATPLYVGGDRSVVSAGWSSVSSYLLRAGLPLTLAESRVLGFEPWPGIRLSHPRPRMYRSRVLGAEEVDYLYSELTLVTW